MIFFTPVLLVQLSPLSVKKIKGKNHNKGMKNRFYALYDDEIKRLET